MLIRSLQQLKSVRAVATVALALFAFQALALHAPCACGHCGQASSVPAHHDIAKPVVEHSCCHHREETPKTSSGMELHNQGCTCGDQAESAPVICDDAKSTTAGELLLATSTLAPVHVETEPAAREALGWLRATGPPGLQLGLYLQFQALLI